MPDGIKTASAIFQRAVEQVLGEDMYQDDICIRATNENEFKKKTNIILNRLRKAKMIINENKRVNDSSKIYFIGYSICYITRVSVDEKDTKNCNTYK